MKPLLKSELSQLLSSYVDRELDDRQMQLVEEIVSKDAEARAQLGELRALKTLVAQKKRLPASIGFWTRVSSEIERRKKEEDNLLPFPRRYFPLVAGAAAVLVIALSIVLYQQRASVVNYVSKQTERVQKAVGDNVLKGSIMPLFSRVEYPKNDVEYRTCWFRLPSGSTIGNVLLRKVFPYQFPLLITQLYSI